MNRKLQKFTILSLVILLITGCVKLNAAVYQVYDSKSMPDSVRTEAKSAVDKIEEALIANNADFIKDNILTSQQSQIENYELKLAERHLEDSDQILNLDDFYITGSSSGQVIEIPIHDEANSFKIRLKSNPADQYVRVTLLKNPTISYLLLQIYAEEKNQWKLGAVSLCDYEYDGMNVQELLNRSRDIADSGDTWIAYCYVTILQQLMSSSDAIIYDSQSDYEKLRAELQQSDMNLPLSESVLTEKEGRITLVSVDGIATQQGMALLLYTVTELPLPEQDKLKMAAQEAAENIASQIPEIKQYFKYIVIRQYEEPPTDSNKTYEYLSSVISLEK